MSLFDSSNKGVKFTNVGDTITGTVAGAPTERQQTKFGTQDPAFWPNGDPMMQIIVPMQTALRESPDDDGARTLYVASKNMKKAIADAMRASGAPDILPGGSLTVQYVGNDPASKNPANPAKMYQARYTPGVSAFAQPAAAVQAEQAFIPQTPPQQPAPVQQVPQQAVMPSTGGVPAQPAPTAAPAAQQWLSEQQVTQLAQLRAAGIDEATISTAIGATPEAIAAHDATEMPF